MRKLMVLLLAAGLFCVFATPASAVENIFGGYWRTRAYINTNFTGEDQSEDLDTQMVDTRTRLYYTAKFNEDFKFVNKFEFNTIWGDDNDDAKSYQAGGDIGTDGMGNFRIKNSYADFTLGSVNSKIGMQGAVLSRGLLFDDDFAGAVFTYNAGDMNIPVFWMKAYEGYNVGGEDFNDYDVDYYGIRPSLKVGAATVQPLFMWITSSDVRNFGADYADLEAFDLYYFGVDVDVNLDVASLWFTGIYETGSADGIDPADDGDVSAYLLALGGSADVGAASVHGQIFYATGDDNENDDDQDAFLVPAGQSYYWSEIMGYGTFDENASANSCADAISNVMALNLGVTIKPADKLSLTADLWYAALAEDNAAGDDVLGTEIDLKATYKLMDNLNLDVVGAYLFAGDATYDGANDADPYELGTRVSFSF